VARLSAMVRPHEGADSTEGQLSSRCTDPAGGSPAPVSTGAPGSRPQARGEIPAARAGRREPLRRERGRGPQHHVNPAASSDYQPKGRGGRAGHATAKATDSATSSEQRWTPSGYGERHVSTVRCGTGEALPGSSRQSGAASIRRVRNGAASGGSPRGSKYRGRAARQPSGGKGPYFDRAFAWG